MDAVEDEGDENTLAGEPKPFAGVGAMWFGELVAPGAVAKRLCDEGLEGVGKGSTNVAQPAGVGLNADALFPKSKASNPL